MKFTFWILSAYSISLLSCAEPTTQPAARDPANEVDKCPKDSRFPVCGTNGAENLLFGNECLLKEAGRKRGDFKLTTLKTCFKDCDLICLGYNEPLCAINPATNKTQTFNNRCEVIKDACSKEIDWKYKKQGKCTKLVKKIKRTKAKAPTKTSTKRRLKPIPCPKIFNPVCAIFTGVKSTFINECLVNAENVKTGKDWRIFSQGICEEDYSSVSKTPKRHVIKKRNLDIKEFGNFENAFELGGPVNYIRPPPIFHTQFIQSDGSMGVFGRAESNMRTFYENQPQTKPVVMAKTEQMFIGDYLKQPGSMGGNTAQRQQLPIEDFSFTELIKNMPNLYQQETSKMQNQYQNQYQSQDLVPAQYAPLIENSRPPTALTQNKMNAETCKMGTTQVCCRFQNATRTFKNICELNLYNALTGEDWQLEYEGHCRDCNFTCSHIFEPLCISMNGLQYTIRNECILNAAICKNKARAWKIIKSGACDEAAERKYHKIEDKYETASPGFRFTSNYRQLEESSTMKAMPAATTSSAMKPKEAVKKSKQIQNQKTIKTNAKKLEQKDGKDYVVVLKQLKNEEKSVNKENYTTTPKSLETQIKNPLLKNNNKANKKARHKTATQQRSSKTTENRVSMYGPQGDSVMSTLIKALEESTGRLLPQLKQETKAEENKTN